MKIIEKDGEFTMQDFPATNWAMGFVLLFGTTISFAVIIVSKDFAVLPKILILVLASYGGYGAYKKLSSPIILTRIKPLDRTIEITDITLGLIRRTKTFDFSQIKCFEMVRRKPERAFLYFHVMTLSDGSQIDLESSGNATSRVSGIPNKLNEMLKNHKSLSKRNRKIRRQMKAPQK